MQQNDINGNSEGFLEDILLSHMVIQSGMPNRYGCRIQIKSSWNVQLMETLLNQHQYHDMEVTEWLKFGFPVSREEEFPDPWPNKVNHKGATMFPEAIEQYLEREISMGATMGPFTIPPFISRIGISPLSSRLKRDSTSRRIILDLSFPAGYSVNDGIDKHYYCGKPIKLVYPTIDTLVQRIVQLKNPMVWKKDISRYFRIIPLCPGDYSLIGMRWNNLLYSDKFFPMGLVSAAYVAQRLSSAIVFLHHSMHYFSCNYLDDFGSAEEAENAWNSYQAMENLLSSLGVKEAKEKSVPPCHQMEFLGNTVDTIKRMLEVSPDRCQALYILEELQEWSDRKTCTKKQIQSLIGKLSFVTNCVRLGRVFLARMIDFMASIPQGKTVKVDEETRKDITWWKYFLPTFDGISMMWLQDTTTPGAIMATDVCLTGAGGVCGREYFHYKFTDKTLWDTSHISQREMLTICITVKMWYKKLTGKLIRIACDNDATVQVINRGRTKDQFMLQCLRELVSVSIKGSFMIKTVHIRTMENIIPDLLS